MISVLLFGNWKETEQYLSAKKAPPIFPVIRNVYINTDIK